MRLAPTGLLAFPIVLLSLGACASGSPLTSPTTGTGAAPPGNVVVWGSCEDLAAQVSTFYDAMGAPSPLDGWADRMQCGQLSVPLDYDRPDGRQITLAVSRWQPEQDSTGTVITNPGGPGVEGRTMPALVAASQMADLASDHTLIGVDVRGSGGSQGPGCDALLDVEAPVGAVDEQVALAYSRDIAAASTACVDTDPDYFGVSWGTELGVTYLTQFPDRVQRMLLDSMTDLRHDTDSSLDDIAEALRASPGTEHGTPDALMSSDVYSPISFTARTAMTCNAYSGAADPARVWAAHLDRAQRLGLDPQDRISHPVSADLPGTAVCAGWPIAPQPSVLPDGRSDDNLQIVAHAAETVTPAAWGQRAHLLLSGNLTVLDDADHGSLANGSAAGAAVQFLRTGVPIP